MCGASFVWERVRACESHPWTCENSLSTMRLLPETPAAEGITICRIRYRYSPQSRWIGPRCCHRVRRCTPWSRTARPGVGCPHNLASSWCFVFDGRGCGLRVDWYWLDIAGLPHGASLLFFVSGVTRNLQGDKGKSLSWRFFFLGVTNFELQREGGRERGRHKLTFIVTYRKSHK